jgi:hypothetical protein
VVPSYRESGETSARKQGQPSRSKLDPHEGFIVGLIEERPDITLAEIVGRLAVDHGARVVPSTMWVFLDWRGITWMSKRRSAGGKMRYSAARSGAPFASSSMTGGQTRCANSIRRIASTRSGNTGGMLMLVTLASGSIICS